ncbi:DUF6544 family protein [Maribacter sp.]|uniref:DUF6544 family protein n=1 Tax=Maribacter sp. TaxID=1897614 RepID=UPI0025C0BA92|nr:DUF6544 family protein [Maribacter sp.]
MKIAFTIIILVHGIIHFMGFAKAFEIGNLAQFTKEIYKPLGISWLFTGFLFILSTALYFMKKDGWPILITAALVFSQLLIFAAWKDAKFGTIANIMILIVAILGFGAQKFKNSYNKDVLSTFQTVKAVNELLTEKDLMHLPPIVQNYLRYVGVVNKPKVHNFRIIFDGQMRDKGKDWFGFTSEQYNFVKEPTRLFFMKAKMKGIPTHGYHSYKNVNARMQIKLLSLFSVVDMSGEDLFATETVTFFNDLCLFAPAALIDKHIQWKVIDETSVKATYINNSAKISAILYFNTEGQLINFVSNDRIAVSEMKTFPFSTPVKNYKTINGLQLPTYGEAVWHYPEGEFVYGKFKVKSVEYNVIDLEYSF